LFGAAAAANAQAEAQEEQFPHHGMVRNSREPTASYGKGLQPQRYIAMREAGSPQAMTGFSNLASVANVGCFWNALGGSAEPEIRGAQSLVESEFLPAGARLPGHF
jgi:hypothetical protein